MPTKGTIQAHRYHDICAGHRVYQHESKCAHLHGHNYRVHFTVEGKKNKTDSLGRVMDFSVIKEKLCMWIEEEWDHRFLVWNKDPLAATLALADPKVVEVPFNPTAEAMAEYLVERIGPSQLNGTGVVLTKVLIEETAKCFASYTKEGY